MAGQLATLFAQRLEVPVVLTDVDAGRIERGVAYVHGEISKLAQRGRISPDRARRLTALVSGSLSMDAFADADFVIEAVFEELAVKQQVFGDLEAVVGSECVLATNTSSLPVTEMASRLAHPERLVGFHFFNPVAVLPLVEVIRGAATDERTLATAFAVCRQLKKSGVLVADAPAFVVNRLLTRFLSEVIATVDEGTPVEVADRALAPLGLPMTPFVLLSLVGPAVALHVSETLHAAFPERFAASANLGRLVAAGKPGIYAMSGAVDASVRELFVCADRPSTGDQVRDRTLAALAEEARLMLDAGVVAAPQDIDLCLLLGAGWPLHLGGILPYLDRTGVAEQVTGARFLPLGVASLPVAPGGRPAAVGAPLTQPLPVPAGSGVQRRQQPGLGRHELRPGDDVGPAGPRQRHIEGAQHPGRPGRQHHDPVGQVEGLLDVVGDEQHGTAVGQPYLLQPRVHLPPRDRVERPERLIEQQHLPVEQERPQERQPLAHATGELHRPGVLEAGQAETGEQRRGPLPGRGRRCAGDLGTQHGVAHRPPPRQQQISLRLVAGQSRPADGGRAADARRPGARHQEPGQHPQHGGLAAAAGPDQADELPRRDGQVDAVQRGHRRGPGVGVRQHPDLHCSRGQPALPTGGR